MKKKIAVVGGGNIGMAFAEGVRLAGLAQGRVIIVRKSNKFSKDERKKFSCKTSSQEAVACADIVVVAVRPKQLEALLDEVKSSLRPDQLLISVVSGKKIAWIEERVGPMAVVRAMPNTAIRIRESMTALAFNEKALAYQSEVKEIFNAVGQTLVVPEEKFPQATVLFASAIALDMKYNRAKMQAAIQHGFHEGEALLIASQVSKGAAMLLLASGSHPEIEIDKVTTPDGCTIVVIIVADRAGFSSSIHQALGEGIIKSRTL